MRSIDGWSRAVRVLSSFTVNVASYGQRDSAAVTKKVFRWGDELLTWADLAPSRAPQERGRGLVNMEVDGGVAGGRGQGMDCPLRPPDPPSRCLDTKLLQDSPWTPACGAAGRTRGLRSPATAATGSQRPRRRPSPFCGAAAPSGAAAARGQRGAVSGRCRRPSVCTSRCGGVRVAPMASNAQRLRVLVSHPEPSSLIVCEDL